MSKAKAKKAGKAKAGTRLASVGKWATVWWAATGTYIVLLVWQSRNYYVERVVATPGAVGAWLWAFRQSLGHNAYLAWLLFVLMAFWGVLAYVWLEELKKQKISTKDGLKDLLLTIRR